MIIWIYKVDKTFYQKQTCITNETIWGFGKGVAEMRIGVVGSINMDMTVTAQRIPGKGETITGDAIAYIPGGKGANQAVAAARLGADVTMFGCVGNDDHGKALIENLKNEGIHTEYIKVRENQVTGLAVITVAESDNCIIVLAGANNTVDIEYINGIKEKLLTCDIVLLQQEILQETVEYVIGLCASHGVKVILNPAPARELKRELIELLDYITPNEHEARIIFGETADTESLLKQYPEKLIITQGEKGVIYIDHEKKAVALPARKSNVVDTTGAGDTFNGAFAVALGLYDNMEKALAFAVLASGLSVEKFGAQGGMPKLKDVTGELESRFDGSNAGDTYRIGG